MNTASRLPKSKSLHAALRRVSRTQRELFALVFDPALSRSYWPDEPRKSKPKIVLDLLWWLLRTGEAPRFYYVYGRDRASVRRADIMSFRRFQQLRNRANLRMGQAPHNYNYVCILRDKFLFSQFAASLCVATPGLLALLDAQHVRWLDRQETEPLESLAGSDGPSVDGFCKKLAGMQGDGAFPLRLEHGTLAIAGAPASLSQLKARLTGRFIFQRCIEQHPQMQALNASSVNTLRLVSFYANGRARVCYGALRIGSAHTNVDNWAAGGLIVRVDLDAGELRGDGFYKPGYGGRTAVHPDSGLLLDGFKIPCFLEAMAMVVRLHDHLPQIHSIGWDVAVSTTGPVVIEGNDDWDGAIQMVLDRGFKQQFLSSLSNVVEK